MRSSLQAYKKVSVDSQLTAASPHKVIQMLLAGAVERLIQSKTAMAQGELATKGEKIGKAMDIIMSLKSCLSMEEGGEIAENLDALYQFMIMQLTKANRDNSVKDVDDVIDILREIKSAWDQIPSEYHNITKASA